MYYAGKTVKDRYNSEQVREVIDHVGTLQERRSDDFLLKGRMHILNNRQLMNLNMNTLLNVKT
jgi:hypothetical protein